jgi:single-strand DNA-binding protein
MSRGINKVMILGYLGADPEARAVSNGSQVVSIRVATKEVWNDKASGQRQERTEWHKISLFGKIGEIAAKYLKKGSQVFIEGSLRTNKWQDKEDGKDRYSTEIIGSSLQLLGSSKDDEQRQVPVDSSPSPQGNTINTQNDEDDDIPF